MKKHILVISQYFYPEQFRINDICTEWVKRGYKVTVITGIPNYPAGSFYKGYGLFRKRKETYNGIEIIRLPIIPRGQSPLMLAFNYLSFVVSGFFWKVFTCIKADYVFIYEVSPMTQALLGIWYAKRHKLPCYLYVQDLWPENVEILAGITNKFIIGSINRMVNYIYRKSTKIFCTSNSFVQSISKRKVEIEKIEFWPQYAEDYYIPIEHSSVPEMQGVAAFNVIFTGNIGSAQGLDILPKTAGILKEMDPDIKLRFHLVGDGRYKDTLRELVNEKNISDLFNFIPKQPADRIPEFLGTSDAALICLIDNPVFCMTIPAKLQTYMACGIPILASADGETSQIIQNSNGGLCSPAGDAQKLADIIIKLMGMIIERSMNGD